MQDIPGKELFQYYEGTERKTIDSGMVNEYIRNISKGDFTAKDFRTWSGTVQAFLAFKELGEAETKQKQKKNSGSTGYGVKTIGEYQDRMQKNTMCIP